MDPPPTTTNAVTTLPPTVSSPDPPTTIAKTDPTTTISSTEPLTTVETSDPLTTISSTDPPTNTVKTGPPTTNSWTHLATTTLNTDLPIKISSSDLPKTTVSTDPPTTISSNDIPTTIVKTASPTTESSTKPPTTTVKTDQPATILSTDPPTTNSSINPPTSISSTDSPTTTVKTTLPTTTVNTEPLTTTVETTDPPTTVQMKDSTTTTVKDDLFTTISITDLPTTAAKTDPPANVFSTDSRTTTLLTHLPTTFPSTGLPTTAGKPDTPTATVQPSVASNTVKNDAKLTTLGIPTTVNTNSPTTLVNKDMPTSVKSTTPVTETDSLATSEKIGLTTTAETITLSINKTDSPITSTKTEITTSLKSYLSTSSKTYEQTGSPELTSNSNSLTTVEGSDSSTTNTKEDQTLTIGTTNIPVTTIRTVPSSTNLTTEQQIPVVETASIATTAMTEKPTTILNTDPLETSVAVNSHATSTNADLSTTTQIADTIKSTIEANLLTTTVTTNPLVATSQQTELTSKLLTTTTVQTEATTTDLPVTSLQTDPKTTWLKTDHPSTTVKTGLPTTYAENKLLTTTIKANVIETTESSIPQVSTEKEDALTTTVVTNVNSELPTSLKFDFPTTTLMPDSSLTTVKKDKTTVVAETPLKTTTENGIITSAEKMDVQTTAVRTDPITTVNINIPVTTANVESHTTTSRSETPKVTLSTDLPVTTLSTDLPIITTKTNSHTTTVDTEVPTTLKFTETTVTVETSPLKATVNVESPSTNAMANAITTGARTNLPTVFDTVEPMTSMRTNTQPVTVATNELTTTSTNHVPTQTTDDGILMASSSGVPGPFSETSSMARSTSQYSGPLGYISTLTTTAISYVTSLVTNSPFSSESGSANTKTESLLNQKNTASSDITSPVTQKIDSITTVSLTTVNPVKAQPLTAPPTVVAITSTLSTTHSADHVSSPETTQPIRYTSPSSSTTVTRPPTTTSTQKPVTTPLASIATSTTTSTTTSVKPQSTTRRSTTTTATTTSSPTTTSTSIIKSSSVHDSSTSSISSVKVPSSNMTQGNNESKVTQSYTSLVPSHSELYMNSTASTIPVNVTTALTATTTTDQGTVVTSESKEPESSSTVPLSLSQTTSPLIQTKQVTSFSNSPVKSNDVTSDVATPSTTYDQHFSTLEAQPTTSEIISIDMTSTSNTYNYPTTLQTASRSLATTVATPVDLTSANNPSSEDVPSSTTIPSVTITSTESNNEKASTVTVFASTTDSRASASITSVFTAPESTTHSGLSHTTTTSKMTTTENVLQDRPPSTSIPPVISTSTESTETKTSVSTLSDFKVYAPTTSVSTTHPLSRTTTTLALTTSGTTGTTALLPTTSKSPLTMTTPVTTKVAEATTVSQPETKISSTIRSTITDPTISYSLDNLGGSNSGGSTLAMNTASQQELYSSATTKKFSEITENQVLPSTTSGIAMSETSHVNTNSPHSSSEGSLSTSDVQSKSESLISSSQSFTEKSPLTSNGDLFKGTYQQYKTTESGLTITEGPSSSIEFSGNSSLGNHTTLSATTEVSKMFLDQLSSESTLVSETQSSTLEPSTIINQQATKQITSSTSTTPKMSQITSTTSTTTTSMSTSTASTMSRISKVSSQTKVVTQSITPKVTKELTSITNAKTTTDHPAITELLTTESPPLVNDSFSTHDQLHTEEFLGVTTAISEGTETDFSSTTELSTQTDTSSMSTDLMASTSNEKFPSTTEFTESSLASETSSYTDWSSDSSSLSDSSTTNLASSTELSTELTQSPTTTPSTTTPVPTMPFYRFTSTTSTTSTTTSSSTVKAKTPLTGASQPSTASRSVSDDLKTPATDILTSTTESFPYTSTLTADSIQSTTETVTSDLPTSTDFLSTTDSHDLSTTELTTAITETDSTTSLPTTTMLQVTTTTTLPPVILTTQSTTTTSATTRSTSTTSNTDSTTELTSTTPETSTLAKKSSETDLYTTTEVPSTELSTFKSSLTTEQDTTWTTTSGSSSTPMAKELSATDTFSTDTTPVTIPKTDATTAAIAITTIKPGLSFVNLTTDSDIMKTNTEYNFTVKVESHYQTSCTVNYGDGNTDDLQVEPPLPLLVFTHSYADQSEGRVWVEASCQDRVSDVKTGLWVDVVKPLLGFNLTSGPNPLPIPPGLATFTLSFPGYQYEGQTINMTYDFGDGNTQFHELSENTSDGVFMVLHTYQFSSVPLSASVILANKAGYVKVMTKVNMEQMITGATLKLVGIPRVELHSEIQFRLTLSSGSNVELIVDFGDGTVKTMGGSNSTIIAHTYTSEGNYSIVAEIRNGVSKTTYELPEKILARRSLNDIDLQTRTHAALPLGEFPMTIFPSQNYKDVMCVFDMGHEIFERFFPRLDAGSEINIDYSYAGVAPGIYQMVVNCSNNISVTTFQEEIIIVELINSLALDVKPLFTQVGDIAVITVSIAMGSNITYVISFGDGVIETRGDTSLNMTVRYAYNTSGTFMIRASAVNYLSQAQATATVNVVEAIEGATFNHHSIDLYTGRVYHGTGPDHNMFNVDRKLVLTANTTSGSNLLYYWELDDGTVKETSMTRTAHLLKKYYKATNVTAVVTITNGIMNVTEMMHVILREPAAIGSFTNDGPVRAMKNITFTLTIKNPSPTTCVLLRLHEETVLQGAEVCETIFASHSFGDQSYVYIREPLRERIDFVEMYEKEGLTSVDVTVFNWVSRSFAVSQAAITRAECKYPLVKIFGRGQDVEAPQVTTVSEQVVVEAMVKVNCEYSDRASFTWSLWKTVTKGESLGSYRNTLMNGSLSRDVRTLQPKVVFPPHYFAPDTLYNVSLSVVMLDMPEITTTDSFYIYVKSRPLEINFLNGNARAIGYNKMYTIDVVSKSRDPDAPLGLQRDFSTWRFVWLCYRKGEPELHPDYSPLIDLPVRPVNITVYNDRGGCFGSGPGRLNVSDTKNVLHFNSRNSPLNNTLIFVVHVTTPTKTKKAYQRVEICKGDPPEIVIRCMSNCQVKVNPNDTYAILGRCLTCEAQGVTLTYNWTLYEFNSSTERFQLVTDLQRMAPGTGVGGRSINIKEGELAPGKCYRIQLAGSSPYTATSYTQLDFCTTRPPFGGNCSVSPEVGIVLETGFSVTCERWINPETETSAGLKYQVWSQVQGGQDPPVLLSASPHPEVHNLVFGPGEEAYNYTHLVAVYISHELGAYTIVHRSLRVEPLRLNADEMNDFMHSASEDLKGLMTSGDSQKGFQKASAMGSLLNSAVSADSSNMKEEELTASAQQQEEERKNLRATLINVVGSSKVYTLDAIQQCSGAISTVTKVATEVSEQSQRNTIGYMSDMAGSLTRFTEGNKGEPPSMKTTVDAATGLIASVANAGKAAALTYQRRVARANDLLANLTDWNSTDDLISETTTTTMMPTTTDSLAMTTLIATSVAAVEEATNLVRDVTTGMMSVSNTVAGAVLTNQVPGQAPVTIQSEAFDLIAGRELAEALGNTSTRAGSGGFKLPSVGSLGTNKTPDFLDQKAMSMSENPFVWGSGASNLKSSVVSLTLGDGNGNDLEIKDTDEDIFIDVDIDPSNVPEAVEFSPFVRRDATWDNTHVINVANNSSAIYLVIRPDSNNVTFEVLIRFGERADDDNYDFAYQIPRNLSEEGLDDLSPELEEEMTYSIFVSPEFIDYHGSGDYFVRVKQQVNFSLDSEYYYEEPAVPTTLSPESAEEIDIFSMDDYVYPWYEEPPNPYANIELANYTLQTITPICRYWNTETESWGTDGCRVTPATNTRMVRCACNHLTSFGSDFFVPPNTIDFGSVYNDLGAKLKDNFAVLVTICVILALYILVGIWARYKDKQDVKKWGITALSDNLAGEKYLYLLTVVTGMKAKSGTASNISFVLTGDDEDTGVRKLSDDKRKEHTRGSSVQYVMSTEGPLGHLTYLRIWHDNTGKGDKAGWFLDRFTVSDLQTGKTFAFMVNRWLAVDEDDGQIDRLVPVATPEDITAFRNLFVNTSKKNLTDGHLWVSIFVRPHKSTYTRVQRLSVVVSVTFLTMVVNAMFYKSEPVRTTRLELGFMTITTFQLWVSIMGTMIVIPPSIAMDQIFRKCRPRPTKTDTLLQKVAQAEDGTIVNNLEDGPNDDDSSDKKGKKKKKKKPITLPWWCVFIAWLLVAGAIGVSAFMVFSYSIQWGKEKANSWLTAILLSIFQSVLIIQPAKVFVLAAILAIVLKKPDVEDLDEEERRLNGSSAADEELDVDRPKSGTREKIPMKPIDPKKLEKIRRKRLAEREMLTLIKEMLIYVVYLFFLLFLAQQNRNSNAFLINKNLRNLFIDYDVDSNEMFQKPGDVFSYMRDTFLPSVFWTEWYNGEEISRRDKPFMADGVSFRIGAVRLRQVRIRPDECRIHNKMAEIHDHCNVPYSMSKEDEAAYLPGWVPAGNKTQSPNSPWVYRSMGTLKGTPVVGVLTTYNGGGFVVDMSGPLSRISLIIDHLEEEAWLDKYTRAVFLELAVLNPYVNLFSRLSLAVEFSHTGLAFKSHQINTFQLYSYVGPSAVWIIFCEAMVLVFIIIFFVRIFKKLRRQKKEYLKSFWNSLELCKVILSIVAIVMYAMKNAYVKLSLGDIADREGEFMNFQRLALWNETFIYLIAFVCFISILECLHLLRFNVKMSMLARTLRYCSAQMFTFSITFLTSFLAFVQFAYVAFSPGMGIYKNFVTAVESMLGHLLGDIDMVYMKDHYGWFGVSFYFVFIFVMTFIVLNMFFTILGDAFSVTKEEIANEKNQYELLNFVTGLVKDMLGMRSAAEREAELNAEEEDEEETPVEELVVPALSVEDSDALDREDSKKREKGTVPEVAVYTAPTTPPPTQASAHLRPPPPLSAIPGDGLPGTQSLLQPGSRRSSLNSAASGSAPPSPAKSILRASPSDADSGVVADSGELPGAMAAPLVTEGIHEASQKVIRLEVPPPACYIPPGEQSGDLTVPGDYPAVHITPVPDASLLYSGPPTPRPCNKTGSIQGGRSENAGGLKEPPRPLSASFLAGIDAPETPLPSQVATILSKLETMESQLENAVCTSPLDG
ncbi:uncharacterized protein [Palaemon carinicauda]|uniref:uncharacterized protein n=1 Tax=Palaemon carinicauda TaxID=392227 RepID=UPI0035B64C75